MKKIVFPASRIAAGSLIPVLFLIAISAFVLFPGCSRPNKLSSGNTVVSDTVPTPVNVERQDSKVAVPAAQVPAAPTSAGKADAARDKVSGGSPAVPEEVPAAAPAGFGAAVAFDPAILIALAVDAQTEEELANIETELDRAIAEGSLDQVILALESVASKPSAPPGIQIALSIAYGRKGLITKSYAAIVAAETAAKAPGIVFNLAAVYGRKALIAADPRAGLGIVRLSSEPSGALVLVDGRETGITPIDLILPSARQHEISLCFEGYEELVEILSLEATKTATISRALNFLPATIIATSDPAGANFLVDGVDRGRAPITVKVEANKEHRVEFKLANYSSYFDLVKIGPGQGKEIKASLAAHPGSIYVETDPSGAGIWLDGQFFKTPHLFEALAAGEHILLFQPLRVGKDFFSADSVTIPLEPGQSLNFKKKLAIGEVVFNLRKLEPGSRLTIDDREYALRDEGDGTLSFVGKLAAGVKDIKVERGPWVWSGTREIGTDLGMQLSALSSCYTLPRRTITIDGKDDDWAGLEKVFKPSGFNKTPQVSGSQIAGGNICRDDKNIYIKIDYVNGKPALVRGGERGLNFGPNTENWMQLKTTAQDGQPHVGIMNSKDMTFTEIGSYALGPSFLELRFPISAFPKQIDISKPLKTMLSFYIYSGSGNGKLNWDKTANYSPTANILVGK